ncbi:MAG: ABC transporter ATP-binding protein [Lachnospiraceae bacterium]|nr:ABC transporter ATP-binding protein [Lachnospiraceae bacterium]
MGEVCLEVKGISKSYHGKKAVDGLSFVLAPGQVLGLIGTNGAGKSTTISMVATLTKPDEGQILFHGKDVRKNPRPLREKLGYVPQDIALYESLSGMDNLKFWGRAGHLHGARLKERICVVSGMTGFEPETLKKRVGEYSGGMKRRMNIAAALLKEPELLILDEPTAGVDIQSRNLILGAIRKLADAGTAVIYVGHYMDEVEKLCDSICVLDRGHTVCSMPLREALCSGSGRITLAQLYDRLFEETGMGDNGCLHRDAGVPRIND